MIPVRRAMVAVLAALPVFAHAQADNSNSITSPDRIVVAAISRVEPKLVPRWLREEPRRREPMHAAREGLTAAELGLLYGTEFALGAEAEGPVPVPAP